MDSRGVEAKHSVNTTILHKIVRFAAVLKHEGAAGSMKSPFVTYKNDLREAMVLKRIAMQWDVWHPSLFLVE